MALVLLFVALCCVVGGSGVLAEYDNAEAKLYRDLMEQYSAWNPNRNVRPTGENASGMTVKHSLALQNIVDVDEENNVATFMFYEGLYWNDAALRWSDSSIPSLRIDPALIWSPDVMNYNKVDEAPDRVNDNLAVVYSSGDITDIAPVVRKVQCQDEGGVLVCKHKLGSWTYAHEQLDLQLQSDDIDTSSFTENEAYELLDTDAARQEKVYECCPEAYVSVTYTIKIQKRGGWFTSDARCIVPSSLVLMLATLINYFC